MEDYEGDDASQQGVADALRDPRGVLRRRWRAMAAVFAAGLAASLAFVMTQAPTYKARATVLVESQKVSEEFVRPSTQEDALERINALTGEVLARPKLEEIIEQRHLYPGLRNEKGSTIEAIVRLRKNLVIELDKGIAGGSGRAERARVLSIEFTADDPQSAADVANDVAHAFNAAGMRLGSQQAHLTTEFMRREVESNEAALREQSRKVSEYQQGHRGALPSEMESNLRRLERLQQQRNSLAMQIAEAETRAASIAAQVAPGDSPSARLQDLRAALARELAVDTETHPNVISLRKQIALLEQELAKHPERAAPSGGGRVAQAAQGEVAQLRQQLAQADRDIEDLDHVVAQAPALAEQLAALQERETVLRETYQESLRKLKEAELAENLALAQQGDRVSVLDQAFPPSKPEQTRWKTLVLGFVGSGALALFAALFLEWQNPVLLTRDSLEAAGDVPVLGCVPRIL